MAVLNAYEKQVMVAMNPAERELYIYLKKLNRRVL